MSNRITELREEREKYTKRRRKRERGKRVECKSPYLLYSFKLLAKTLTFKFS